MLQEHAWLVATQSHTNTNYTDIFRASFSGAPPEGGSTILNKNIVMKAEHREIPI
jgi:hypothetical protein